MSPHSLEILAALFFGLSLLHTFGCSWIRKQAYRFPKGSLGEECFHLLGEVEVVFGLWAALLVLAMALHSGGAAALDYLNSLHFTEPLFVFAIMVVAATRPVILVSRTLILATARLLPIRGEAGVFFASLVVGPLLGSFITEPAAMTVIALLLKQRYFDRPELSSRFKYTTLATLFVNISIGGAMTPFAAPPVLMVAAKWNWDLNFMLSHFAWKVSLACVLNAAVALLYLRKELAQLSVESLTDEGSEKKLPLWLVSAHMIFLAAIVLSAHHAVLFLGFFMFFLGVTVISARYQGALRIRESLLVAFFLSGLVVLGGMQAWWLAPLIQSLDSFPLFLGATALTSVTDNAALTYLGSQVEGLSESFRYALVAGAIAGGGLTVIANAPNPAGYSILQRSFGEGGVSPWLLFKFALLPTLVAMFCLWLL